MENQKLTHWKKISNPDYLGAYSLYDDLGKPFDLTVAITSIKKEKVVGENGKKDDCTVAQLQGQKPMILNATNKKMLAKLFGSPFIENWLNRPFTLYVANIKVAGEPTDCLRIRDVLPQVSLPELNPQHNRWAGALLAMQKGDTCIADIKKKFSLTPENEKTLVDAAHSAF